ncbi:hydroxyacylglutathione hydrolase [Thaumasiovibrio subtropicus]|uniref:hydroxyacylglutathione hydrolase n=1 Tax=Thaumasiovibrio subtropicus TaxID=1891207 RepID=UPI000B3566A0|nr:hydroxyacylglutathione hydrolase [Thaumasiovibrio subtropicus]
MLTVESIPAFNDNYIWLIHNQDKRAVVVDPGDARVVLDYLSAHEMTLDAILITHHHADHTGGISELKRHFPNCKVIGPRHDPIPGLTVELDDEDQLDLFGLNFSVLHVPGHTLGHIAFYGDGKLFCGDTLFASGCGRLFEGTPEQMYHSLQRLAQLPEETLVYCTHEYTSSNIAFALVVDPDNEALQTYRDEVNHLRAQSLPTLPSSIGHEKTVNPFLRCHLDAVKQSVMDRTQNRDDIETFTQLRHWKDNF